MTDDRLHKAQDLRNKCARVLNKNGIHEIVFALELIIADTLMAIPGCTESGTISGVDAIAADVRNIVHELFAAQRKGH